MGKSECALDLIVRGHRLVSDDVVEIRRRATPGGHGTRADPLPHEIRGLGIVNVTDLFGVAAVRQNKFVEFVIRLDPWKPGKRYERLGLDERGHGSWGSAPLRGDAGGAGTQPLGPDRGGGAQSPAQAQGLPPGPRAGAPPGERLGNGGPEEDDDREALQAREPRDGEP